MCRNAGMVSTRNAPGAVHLVFWKSTQLVNVAQRVEKDDILVPLRRLLVLQTS